MASKIIDPKGQAILQYSALHDYPWPETDPQTISQTTAPWSRNLSQLLDQTVENVKFSLDRFVEETKHLPPQNQVWQLLTSRAFNFNGVEKVRGEAFWLERIQAAMAASEQIDVAYPLICKINNGGKRLTTVGCTAGERAAVRFFRNLGRAVQTLYAPGMKIQLLSDATLYNGALQVPPPSAYAYMNEFRALIEEEQAEPFVAMHDYSAILAPYYRDFEKLYNRHYAKLSQTAFDANTIGSLPTSVRTNVNSRRLGLSYDQLRDLFGPRQIAFLPVRADLDQQSIFALREQLAIKMACVDLNLPNRLWPNHIRATCHKGMKDGRHVLGLRVYPEYYGISRLLPYHGMPLLELDKQGRPRLTIIPEIALRGNTDLIRVLNQTGEPVLYWHRRE